jgi:nicotinate-nucleotide adenylyltransferase
MARIGLFGGSFNPIHVAHLILAERVRERRFLDRVVFVPAGQPPHKPERPLAPAEHRLRMVELAVEGHPAFGVSRAEVERGEPSYTLRTVRETRAALGADDELFLLLGSDSVLDLPNWWHADELVQEVEIIAFERPGAPLEEELDALSRRFGEDWVRDVRALQVDAPLLEISSSDVRARREAGESVRYLVPDAVLAYIEERGLYAPTLDLGDEEA